MSVTLEATVDLGGSGIKAWYSFSQKPPQNELMIVRPHLAKFPQAIIESEIKLGGLPEHRIWLKNKINDPEIIVVGSFAEMLGASNSIYKVKYEDGVFRLLGVIGAICAKHQLFEKLKLKILLLLPFSEYSKKDEFQNNLRKKLKNLYFQQQKLNLELDYFRCFPEGYGIILHRLKNQNLIKADENKISVLMLGYRNSSYLYFDEGNLVFGKTNNLGFCHIVEQVEKVILTEKNNLLGEILPLLPRNLNSQNPLLLTLVSSKQKSNIEKELKILEKTIKAARHKYWFLLKDWINSIEPKILDEIYLLGGTAYFLREEINSNYSWLTVNWTEEIVQKIKELRALSNQKYREAMAYRLVDSFALHNSREIL